MKNYTRLVGSGVQGIEMEIPETKKPEPQGGIPWSVTWDPLGFDWHPEREVLVDYSWFFDGLWVNIRTVRRFCWSVMGMASIDFFGTVPPFLSPFERSPYWRSESANKSPKAQINQIKSWIYFFWLFVSLSQKWWTGPCEKSWTNYDNFPPKWGANEQPGGGWAPTR